MPKSLLSVLTVASLAVSGIAAPARAASAVTLPLHAQAEANIAGQGQLSLAILSTDKVDATRIDPDSVRLGPIAVARWADAQPPSLLSDANADGRTDLRLFFDKESLRANGYLSAATTTLTVSGKLPNSQPFQATHAVKPSVVLEIKFQDFMRVRGTGPTLQSVTGFDLDAVRGALQRHGALQLDPLLPAHTLTALEDATAAAQKSLPDMGSWYHLTLPADANVDKALAELTALPQVAHAYPAPEAAPPPATPNFTSMQGYQRPVPQGVDADHSRLNPRARGAGIRIVDLEYDWNPFHEDLNLTWSSDLGGTQFPRYTGFADEHGTAVFGELVADDNSFGVTGGVLDAAMFGISPIQRLSSGGTSYRPAASLTYLSTILTRGDTVLIEQQTVGPNGGTRYVPLEWIQSVFDAFRVLNGLGVVVVETGGNGGENLDAAAFQGRFNRSVRDSGAIIVGAGSSTNHSRLSFSVYGSRVDLQGWGHNITTTGSNGNLQGGTTPANINIRYTRSFGGTSGAGPIVTGAVVAIQSYLKSGGRPLWTARQLRDLLNSTGTPQGGDTGPRIGPLPNLRAALIAVG